MCVNAPQEKKKEKLPLCSSAAAASSSSVKCKVNSCCIVHALLTGKKKETYFDFHSIIIFIETKWPSKALDWKTFQVRNQHNNDAHTDIILPLKPQIGPVLTLRVKEIIE